MSRLRLGLFIFLYGLACETKQHPETGFCEGRSCPEQEAQANPRLEQATVRSSGMEWRSHGRDNNDLISQLKRSKIIKSPRVEEAMKKVDRGNYCSFSPYMDSPQAIGYGVTISAPHMHAHALEMLKDHLFEGAKALDVGSGIFNFRISVSHPNFQNSHTLRPEESPFSWCCVRATVYLCIKNNLKLPDARWRNPLHSSRKSLPKFQKISFKVYNTRQLISIYYCWNTIVCIATDSSSSSSGSLFLHLGLFCSLTANKVTIYSRLSLHSCVFLWHQELILAWLKNITLF